MTAPEHTDIKGLHERVTALETRMIHITNPTRHNHPPKYRIVESRQGRLFWLSGVKTVRGKQSFGALHGMQRSQCLSVFKPNNFRLLI